MVLATDELLAYIPQAVLVRLYVTWELLAPFNVVPTRECSPHCLPASPSSLVFPVGLSSVVQGAAG